jgi:CRP-like cAMP-binding protein
MLSSDVSSLQKIPMFHNVDAAKLKLIALTSQRAIYQAGERMITEGDRAETVFVILEGKATVSRLSEGEQVTIAHLETGAVMGEMGVVLDRPYSGTIIAETTLVALRIDKRTFMDLLTQVPQLSLALIRELANRLLQTSNLYVKALNR